jgi:hypothetical protein
VTFDVLLSAHVIAGEGITATATSTVAGNTSEFSACLAVMPGPPALTVVRGPASGDLTISWESADATWSLEQTMTAGSLDNWSAAAGSLVSEGSRRTFRTPVSANQVFYRLRKL